MSLSRTWRCLNVRDGMNYQEILNACSIKRCIQLGDKLSEGMYGVVYSGTLLNYDVAIKFRHNLQNYTEIDEAEYAFVMEQLGLGPKVYDSYFYTQYGSLHMVLIMEALDGTVGDALESVGMISVQDKSNMCFNMCKIVEKQFREGIFCYDLAINNFVYKIHERKNIVVKEIDFGQEYCYLKPVRNYPEDVIEAVIATLIMILYFQSGIMLMYSSIVESEETGKENNFTQLRALTAFRKLPYFPTVQNKNKMLDRIPQILNSEHYFDLKNIFTKYIYNKQLNGEQLAALKYTKQDILNIMLFRVRVDNEDIMEWILMFQEYGRKKRS